MNPGRRRVTPRGEPRGTIQVAPPQQRRHQPPPEPAEEEPARTFEAAFAGAAAAMPAHLENRAREIEEQVRVEMEETGERSRQPANRVGDMFITQPPNNRLRQNIGNTTYLDRRRLMGELEQVLDADEQEDGNDGAGGVINLGIDLR